MNFFFSASRILSQRHLSFLQSLRTNVLVNIQSTFLKLIKFLLVLYSEDLKSERSNPDIIQNRNILSFWFWMFKAIAMVPSSQPFDFQANKMTSLDHFYKNSILYKMFKVSLNFIFQMWGHSTIRILKKTHAAYYHRKTNRID